MFLETKISAVFSFCCLSNISFDTAVVQVGIYIWYDSSLSHAEQFFSEQQQSVHTGGGTLNRVPNIVDHLHSEHREAYYNIH